MNSLYDLLGSILSCYGMVRPTEKEKSLRHQKPNIGTSLDEHSSDEHHTAHTASSHHSLPHSMQSHQSLR